MTLLLARPSCEQPTDFGIAVVSASGQKFAALLGFCGATKSSRRAGGGASGEGAAVAEARRRSGGAAGWTSRRKNYTAYYEETNRGG